MIRNFNSWIKPLTQGEGMSAIIPETVLSFRGEMRSILVLKMRLRLFFDDDRFMCLITAAMCIYSISPALRKLDEQFTELLINVLRRAFLSGVDLNWLPFSFVL